MHQFLQSQTYLVYIYKECYYGQAYDGTLKFNTKYFVVLCNKHHYPKNSAIAETASSKEANVDFMDYAKRIKKDWKRHVYLADYSS